ncbi:hypothetical protein TUBRATIS_26380 [Tubulinosema ratisbonensis]|uniref:Uncharacterized protein n=1 Tax=Tubulinosema ratisbonensis TaxID=291195 RepID=A0A437AIL6_9MICR|nr:hypothetical protein TUBRATIS_26380 [Tubulinosema ratisbonensis]
MNRKEKLILNLKIQKRLTDLKLIELKEKKDSLYLKLKSHYLSFKKLLSSKEYYILSTIFLINKLVLMVYLFLGDEYSYLLASILFLILDSIGLIFLFSETIFLNFMWYFINLTNIFLQSIFLTRFCVKVLASQNTLTEYLNNNNYLNKLVKEEKEVLELFAVYIFIFYFQLIINFLNLLGRLLVLLKRNFLNTFLMYLFYLFNLSTLVLASAQGFYQNINNYLYFFFTVLILLLNMLSNSRNRGRNLGKILIVYVNCNLICFSCLMIFLNNFNLPLVSVQSEYTQLIDECNDDFFSIIVRITFKMQESLLSFVYLR